MGDLLNKRSGKAILFSLFLAVILAFPAVIIAKEAGSKDHQPIQMEDKFVDELDLAEVEMEQYIYGMNMNDAMGYVVKKGYFNNDMLEDIIVSAPGYNNTQGAVFIYLGWKTDRELSPFDADVIIDGQVPEGFFGLDIAVGDVNGDGLTDFLISGFQDRLMTMQYTPQDTYYPVVELFYGKTSWNRRVQSTDSDVTFIGQSPDHGFGWNIEIGDITNDEYDDIVISETHRTHNSYHGWVYLWKGSMAMEPVYNVSMMEYDSRIYTSNSTMDGGMGYWGLASSDLSLGDINGDDYMDILIGSDRVNSRGMGSGEVEVVFGSDILPKEIDLMTYSHVRVESYPGYGLSQVTTTDFNGDGIEDLIVCAPNGFFDHKGGVFLFYGDNLMQTGTLSILDNDFQFRGPYSYWDLGVQGLEDLNGDGRGEIMLTSPVGMEQDGRGSYCIVYADSTDDLADPIYYMQFETPDFVVRGPSRDTLFGMPYLENIVFFEYDGNGLLELAISAPWGSYTDQPPDSGIVYFNYQIMSEIEYLDFELLDADGPDRNILGAGKTYHFQGYVKNTWDINDFNLLDITFLLHGGDMEGEQIILFWDRGLMSIGERSDPNDFVEIESSAVNPDGDNGMWVFFNVTFSQTIPTEEPLDLIVDIRGGRLDMALTLSYGSLFKVEPDVDFFGDLTVIGDYNGVLSKGDYVRPNERIQVTGMMVVYEGTEAPPPNEYFGIRMVDNIGNVFINKSSSGKDIYFTYRTQEIAGREEINLSFVDLVGEADNAAGLVSFFYIVDVDAPDPPEEIIIRADSDIDNLIGYDNDPEVFVTWNPAQDDTSEIVGYMYSFADGGGTNQGTFTENTQAVIPDLREGWNEIFVWSVDSASNFGPSQVASVYYDTEMPTFGVPNPAPGSWVNTRTVNYEMIIKDEDGSGVRGSTVEYAVSFDGGRTYSAWEPTNLRNEGEQVKVRVFLNFREGQDNFIKWRAKDISGNGYIISDEFQVKVDTNPISFKAPIPAAPVEEDYISCGITISDIGAGVDGTTVEYSISYDGVSNYGPWQKLDLGETSENMIVSTPPIFFEKDTLNYIKWRAMDGAGNGYTYSDDYPIDVKPEAVNRDPVPIITSPVPQTKYLETVEILFDGSTSVDPDDDELQFFWYSDKDGYIGTDPILEKRLSQDNHLITLHVFDGISNRSISVKVSVIPDPSSIDTDGDGIPDFNDDDDDNDGLYDIEEDLNKNGLIEFHLNETDPKVADTDGDGYNDRLDVAPLDDTIWTYEDETNLPVWLAILIFAVALILLAVAAILFVLKQRVDKKGNEARTSLRRTRRNVRRFEVLTGVPTNDLPAIEAVQWALPGVINEASEFMLEPVPSDDLLPESPEGSEEEEEEKKPDLEDMEVPEPSVPPSEPQIGGEDVPGPEAPQAPEPEEPPAEGGKMVNCSLCGSEIPVEEGAASVECPLCGEINNL